MLDESNIEGNVSRALSELREAITSKKIKFNATSPLHAFALFEPKGDMARKYINRMVLAYLTQGSVREMETQAGLVEQEVSENSYTGIIEQGARGGQLTMDSLNRVVIPKKFLDVALLRQDKSSYSDLSFYLYRENLATPGANVPYIALYDSPDGIGQEIAKSPDQKRRIGIPVVQLPDLLRKEDRVAFVGLDSSISVLNYKGFEENKARIYAYQLFVHEINKVLNNQNQPIKKE